MNILRLKICFPMDNRKAVSLYFIILIHQLQAFSEQNLASQQYFKIRPVDRRAKEGDDVVLQCTVGNQKGSIQWSKDGFLLGFEPEIPGFPRHSMKIDQAGGVYNLKISNVQLEDEGEYQCQVGPASHNKPIRAGCSLTVIVAPKEIMILSHSRIIKQPLKRGSPEAGSSPSFSQLASHFGDHSHDYHSHPYEPSFVSSEEPSSHMHLLYANEAQRVTLVCNTSSLTKPHPKLLWMRNNDLLKPETYSVFVSEGLGHSGKLASSKAVLVIFVKLDDNGVQYSCKALHPALSKPLVASISISVIVPPGIPQIEGYKNGDQISALDTLTLGCISRGGNPSPTLIWYRDDLVVDTSYFFSQGKDSTNTYSLVVKPDDNNAELVCAANNPALSKPLSTKVKLNVLYPASKIHISGPTEGKIGQSVQLECYVGPSNPATTVKWTVDGKPTLPSHDLVIPVKRGFRTVSNISLLLSEQDSKSKTVTCYGTSRMQRESIFKTVVIQILYPPDSPVISGVPNGTHLMEDDVHRLDCTAKNGNPLATLRWFKTIGGLEQELGGLTNQQDSSVINQLVIKVKSSDNGAIYRCEASNRATLEPLSAYLPLQVMFMSSTLKAHSEPKHPKHGQQVKLVCETGSCNPVCEVTWTMNGILLGDQVDEVMESVYQGRNTRSNIITIVTAKQDQSLVICRSFNKLLQRSVEKSFLLRIVHKPRFSFPLFQKFDVVEESDFVVNITAQGFPPPTKYSWLRNGQPFQERFEQNRPSMESNRIATEEKMAIHGLRHHVNHSKRLNQSEKIERSLNEGPILRINRVNRYDGGEYECEVSNSEGTSKATIFINVLFGATIVKTSEVLYAELTETAKMTCEAIANPMENMTIEWYKEGISRPLQNSTKGRIMIQHEKGRSTLRVLDVRKADEGFYSCKAFNGIRRASITRLRLALKYKPVILAPKANAIVATDEGGDLLLTCKARGIPQVHFKWLDSGNQVITSTKDSDQYTSSGLHRYKISSRKSSDLEHFDSQLNIRKIKIHDLNTPIKCVASNQMGYDSVEIFLRPRGRPEPVENLTIDFVSFDSIRISWTPGFDGGYNTFFRAKVVPLNGKASHNSVASDTKLESSKSPNNFYLSDPINDTSLFLGSLRANQSYSLSVISYNSAGEIPCPEVHFRTLEWDKSSGNGSPLVGGSLASVGLNASLKILLMTALGVLIVIVNCAFILYCIRNKTHKWLPRENHIIHRKDSLTRKNPPNSTGNYTHTNGTIHNSKIQDTSTDECIQLNNFNHDIGNSLIVDTLPHQGCSHTIIANDLDPFCDCDHKQLESIFK